MEVELKNFNMLEYNLFKRAQIAFPSDEQMNLTLPDSVISREKSGILVEYLEKVFCERCGMNLISSLGPGKTARYIEEEMTWRLEY